MPFFLVRGDITSLEVDAIVNAANTDLKMGGGVCGAIFRAAGVKNLQDACARLAPIKTGEAVITPGFDLPATFVIHTAGPIYKDGRSGEEMLLGTCYRNAMRLALAHGLESIAFPLISSGIYGYPKEEALAVAISEIRSFVDLNDLAVTLVIFDQDTYRLSYDMKDALETHIADDMKEGRRQIGD